MHVYPLPIRWEEKLFSAVDPPNEKKETTHEELHKEQRFMINLTTKEGFSHSIWQKKIKNKPFGATDLVKSIKAI